MAQPYKGPYRKLIIAFDVGTTFSGIAYSLLDPGEVPQVHGVTRFVRSRPRCQQYMLRLPDILCQIPWPGKCCRRLQDTLNSVL